MDYDLVFLFYKLGLDMGLWDHGRLYELVKCRFRYQALVIEVVEFQNV